MNATLRIANAPCSWGILEVEGQSRVVDYEQVLDEIAATGYTGTELGDWGFMPTDPRRLHAELDLRGLAMVGAFVPVALAEADEHAMGEETAVRTAELLAAVEGDRSGGPFIVLSDDNGRDPVRRALAGRIDPEQGLGEEDWQTFARGAERIARSVRERTGLRTVFHHHCAGYVETPAEVETLLRLTDPELVGLCFDTGHYTFGGGDALAGLRRHADRTWHVHFKDCDPAVAARSREEGREYVASVRAGVFCELGRGEVAFPAVADKLGRMGYDGWIVVEQDVLPGMGTPKQSAARNRDYLAGLGL